MNPPEIAAALAPIIAVLERLGVAYYIGGSVASSAHGLGRSTLDIDMVADLGADHIAPLTDALDTGFYLEPGTIADAVARRASFSVIHLATMIKIDVFVARRDAFERESLARRRVAGIPDEQGQIRAPLESPEDVILHKLVWFRDGDEVSRRQWDDVLGVIRVQGDRLDFEYLRRWAAGLGVAELFERALADRPRG